MARSKSSARWLREHFDDPYVQRAQREGWRSRGVFKLEEIDRKDHLLQAAKVIVDLGAAPGGWSQYVARRLKGSGQVVAVDLLPMEPEHGVVFIRGDFREASVLQQVLDALAGAPVDLLMSDMAPNMSGLKAVDQPRVMHLAELALELAEQVLRPGGGMLVKVFQGDGFEGYLGQLRRAFRTVSTRKPRASRARSRELYLLARNYGV